MKTTALGLLTGLVLAGCAGHPAHERVVLRLYFGTASPQGQVSPADFEAFLDTAVTPRFPAGLTVYSADGQWRGADGKLVKEKSKVVEIIRSGASDEDA